MGHLETLSAASLGDEAHRALRAAILGGELSPGETVSEGQLARQMGVSRGPVREALARLERTGLILRERNRGYRVATFSERDMSELASLRVALESLAVRLAINSPRAAVELRAVWDRMLAAQETGDRALTMSLDREFHETIVELSEHGRLQQVWETLRDQIELAVVQLSHYYPSLEGRARSHLPLLQAIEKRDLQRALKEVEAHIYDAEFFRRQPNSS